MNFVDWKKTSFIEVPDHISTVLFVNGCNFNCGFCYVPHIVDSKQLIPEQEIFEFLEKRKEQLEFVVVTGGEATSQNDLVDFFKKVKRLRYKTALETNGSNPEVLRELLKKELIDYIAMDIKTDKKNYSKFFWPKEIDKSVKLLKKSSIDYEFRTTMVPEYTQNFEKIVSWITGAKNYYLQQFIPDNCRDEKFRNMKPYTESELNNFLEIAKKEIPNAKLRSSFFG